MKSNQKHMRHNRVRTNNWRAFLRSISCAMLIIMVLAHAPSSLYAQMQSGKVDFIGIYRFSGQSNSHLEFVTRDGKLIVTRVYDNPDLKKKYGERESFFEATLDGREFSGTMTSSSMDKGLPISGNISRDRRTIEWVGKDSQGIQYTSIVYKEEQEEPKKRGARRIQGRGESSTRSSSQSRTQGRGESSTRSSSQRRTQSSKEPSIHAGS